MFSKFCFAFLLIPTIILTVDSSESSEDYCYLDSTCNPDSDLWPAECKTGKHQSPIDLVRGSFNSSTQSVPVSLNFNSGYTFSKFEILNNGHTIQVNGDKPDDTKNLAQMSGYGFDRPYIFEQIHFHWGENNSFGSEHTVNGEHFAMEIHLVHYDSKYDSFSDAAKSNNDSTAVAVVGIFLTAGTEEDANVGFDTIALYAPVDYHPDSIEVNSKLDLSSLLPKAGGSFYRYLGSLTTPNCTEAVEWTVLEDVVKVKPSEIEKFRQVQSHQNSPVRRNCRPIQGMENRKLEYLSIGYSTGSHLSFCCISLILLTAFSFLK